MATIPETSAAAAAAAAQTSASANKNQALGQEQFLTLLVAQLQNQDPLNPTDATQFTSQLAQYSQLEQLFNLNTAMKDLASAQESSDRLSSLSLIGQEVVVEGSTFNLGAEAVELGYKVTGTLTGLNLEIRNSEGVLVSTVAAGPDELSNGNHFLAWDGLDSEGQPLPPGEYNITLKAEGDAASVTPLVRTAVSGVDLSSGAPVLLTGLGNYPIGSIYGAYTKTE